MRAFDIGIDIDDVCADLIPAWQGRYNAKYNDNQTREDWYDWDLTKVVKPECGALVYDILREPDLYDDVKPVEYALEGVNWLREQGHRVYFVTACGYDEYTIAASAGAKFAWLKRWGFLPSNRDAALSYVVTANKSMARVDLLLDDRASTIESFPGHAVLYARPHNALYTGGHPRVRNWHEACLCIQSIAQQPHARKL